jgi:HEAT repeat protein
MFEFVKKIRLKSLCKQVMSEDSATRERAAKVLSESESPAAVEALIQALKHPVQQIGLIQGIDEYGSDPETYYLTNALVRLGNIAVAPLRATLAESGWDQCDRQQHHVCFRDVVVETLLRLGWKPATAQEHVALAVAKMSAEPITAAGQPAIELLVEEHARGDVTKKGITGGLIQQIGRPAVPALCRLLAVSAKAQSETVKLLAVIGDPRCVKPLAALAHATDTEEYAAMEAIKALAGFKPPGLVKFLCKLLATHPKDKVRRSAAHVLGQLGDPAAVPALVEAIPVTGNAGIEALVALAPAEAVPYLCQAIDKHPQLREYAAKALGKLGDPAAIPHLVKALVPGKTIYSFEDQDASDALRAISREWPKTDGAQAAFPFLAEALVEKEIDSKGRERLVSYMYRINEQRLFDPLTKALERADASPSLVSTLAKVDHPGRFEAILRCLHHQNHYVRQAAVRALVALGDPRARPDVEALLTDPHWLVRSEAKTALEKLGSPCS